MWVDWHQLRGDLAADEHAWATFNDWANSYAGRRATEAEYETHLADTVPHRPWQGASSSELVLLRIAFGLALGGLLGDGLARLDWRNNRAVREPSTSSPAVELSRGGAARLAYQVDGSRLGTQVVERQARA